MSGRHAGRTHWLSILEGAKAAGEGGCKGSVLLKNANEWRLGQEGLKPLARPQVHANDKAPAFRMVDAGLLAFDKDTQLFTVTVRSMPYHALCAARPRPPPRCCPQCSSAV